MFEDFEHVPSDELWERIEAGALSEARTGPLAFLLAGYEHAPHPRVWNGIVARMHPLRRRGALAWWSAAAAIVLLGVFWLASGPWQDASSGSVLANARLRSQSLPPGFGGSVSEGSGGQLNGSGTGSDGTGQAAGQLAAHDGGEDGFSPAGMPGKRSRLRDLWGFAGLDAQQVALGGGLDQGDIPFFTDRLSYEVLTDSYTVDYEVAIEDSVPVEIPYFEDFDFGREEPVWASVETQVGSNLAPAAEGSGYFPPRDLTSLFDPEGFSALGGGRYQEDFSTPLAFGLGASKRLKKRWSLGAGLVYTLMGSTQQGNVAAGGSEETARRRQYLGPNVSLSHEFLQRKHFSLYSTAGLQYDFGLGMLQRTEETGNDLALQRSEARLPLGDQAAANMGLGMNLHLTKSLRLYLQGTAANYFYQSERNLWSTRRLWPNAQAGIRFGF